MGYTCLFQFWFPQGICLGVKLLGHMVETLSVETVSDFIFWAPKSLQMVIVAMKLKYAYSLEGKL